MVVECRVMNLGQCRSLRVVLGLALEAPLKTGTVSHRYMQC